MLTFIVLDTLNPNDDVLKMITNTKPSNIKISKGQTLLIERTNIKSVLKNLKKVFRKILHIVMIMNIIIKMI